MKRVPRIAYGDFDLENKFDPQKSERLIIVAKNNS